MNRVLAAGVGLTGLGALGYLLGTAVAYPGRAFAVTAIIAGITLIAIGRAGDRSEATP